MKNNRQERLCASFECSNLTGTAGAIAGPNEKPRKPKASRVINPSYIALMRLAGSNTSLGFAAWEAAILGWGTIIQPLGGRNTRLGLVVLADEDVGGTQAT